MVLQWYCTGTVLVKVIVIVSHRGKEGAFSSHHTRSHLHQEHAMPQEGVVTCGGVMTGVMVRGASYQWGAMYGSV